MALVLQQVRPCDGECCKESPRFPVDESKKGRERGGCIYFDDTKDVSVSGGGRFCKLMDDPDLQKDLGKNPDSKHVDRMSELEWFNQTCVGWPQNLTGESVRLGKTDVCCWQFVEE
jgi:hypothetical protein